MYLKVAQATAKDLLHLFAEVESQLLPNINFKTQISAMRALHLRTVRIWENLGINAQICSMRTLPLQTTLLTHYGALHSQET